MSRAPPAQLGVVCIGEKSSDDFVWSKVGGKPRWLHCPLTGKQAQCPICSKQMVLLLQIFTPIEKIHRCVYVIACLEEKCHEESNLGFRAFSCTVESTSGHTEYDQCSVCGMAAQKRCRKCGVWVCCDSHEMVCCSSQCRDSILREYEIECETEPESDSDISVDEKEMETEFVDDIQDTADDIDLANGSFDDIQNTAVDKEFLLMQKKIKRNQLQAVRYVRGCGEDEDETSDAEAVDAASGDTRYTEQTVPACPHCKQNRSLEMQIMPNLISILDNLAFNFGSLYISTCKDILCDLSVGMKEEHVYRQDFSNHGVDLSSGNS